MRRQTPKSTLVIVTSTLAMVTAACASDGDQTIETIPASPIETTVPEFISDAGQFDDDAMDDAAEPADADDATEEGASETDEGSGEDEPATATSTTSPPDDAGDSDDGSDSDDSGDDGDDDPSVTTQPPSSGTTPATSSTVPPAGSPDTTAPPETTTPPTTTAPTTTPPAADPPAGGADAGAALAGLNAVLAEVDAIDGAAELPLCSLDPSGAQIDELFDPFSTGPFAEAYGSVTAPLAVPIDEQFGTMITCDRFDGDFDNGFGFSAIPAPADLAAFSETFANPNGIEGITVTVTPSGSGNGGDFFQVCSVDSVDPAFSYCEIDWISGGLMVTAWMAGEASLDVDLDALQAGFETILGAVLTNLAQGAG